LYFLPLVQGLDKPVQRIILAAGVTYVCGAFGMELVGGYIASADIGNVAYRIEVIAEESLEITGLTLFVSALLLQLGSLLPPATIRFAAGKFR
jgi:hypothetical protein